MSGSELEPINWLSWLKIGFSSAAHGLQAKLLATLPTTTWSLSTMSCGLMEESGHRPFLVHNLGHGCSLNTEGPPASHLCGLWAPTESAPTCPLIPCYLHFRVQYYMLVIRINGQYLRYNACSWQSEYPSEMWDSYYMQIHFGTE